MRFLNISRGRPEKQDESTQECIALGALNAVLPYILVSVFSDAVASSVRWRILIIAVGSALIEAVLARLFPNIWAAVAILLGIVALVSIALIFWCAVPRRQALKIAGIYVGVRIALGAALILIFGPAA